MWVLPSHTPGAQHSAGPGAAGVPHILAWGAECVRERNKHLAEEDTDRDLVSESDQRHGGNSAA